MKLVSFTVTNYRSITSAYKISLQNYNVLVGKNNEGKSNLLTALSIAMRAMMLHANSIQETGYLKNYRVSYNWKRDFPLQFQDRKNKLDSIIRLNFRLEHDEALEFTKKTGIRSSEDIPIEVKFGKENKYRIIVPKRGSSSFNTKSAEVTAFICERINFNYIKAIRTEDMALDSICDVLYPELKKIQSTDEYKKAIEVIEGLRQNVYDEIANKIVKPLQEFLPNLKSVVIKDKRSLNLRPFFRDEIDIELDDGTPTSLVNKGDGIKSLVSLAMLKELRTNGGASIIAIEEPESHLHPDAIHSLVGVINSISENHQVIITTHNPLFVQRNDISQNIIVNQGTARPAKNIKEIREILGVLPEDNLINASYVLLVEGENDVLSLSKIFKDISPILKDALIKNTLVIKSLSGVNNLCYELNMLRSFMCKCFVFLDNDKAGVGAGEDAINRGYITHANIKYSICDGQFESEFEDCLNSDFYFDVIYERFSVYLNNSTFKGNDKWSKRIRNAFLSQGQRCTDDTIKKVKNIVAETIPDNAECVLNEHKRGAIDSLILSLENMINT